MIAMKLKINQEYFKLVPRPSLEEYEALKESIKADGQEIPIITNDIDEILDGFTRDQICRELGIEPKFIRKTFVSKLLEKKFVIEINLKRRHLTPDQKVEMGVELEPIYAELAKQRMLATHKGAKQLDSIEPSSLGDKGKTSEQTAKAIGTSRATYERGKEVMEKAPDLWKQVKSHELTISGAHENMQLTENLSKDKQNAIEPKLWEIKTEMRKENLSQDEKKRVVEKLATQEIKGKIEDVDIERTVKGIKVESLTKNESPEVQKKAIEIFEQKDKQGIKTQAYEIVREAQEDIKMQTLIPTKSIEQQVKDMYASVDPNAVVENMSKITHGATQKDLIRLIESIISKNHLRCPKCGEQKLKWKCGHDLE